ncbi:hypothetical protein KCM76_23745 [Zooshikella marina]|uniref:hypothetical protein n=1 Tax=Zooshikella ganghwensis TaxID=202772 RepID=UPI001BB0AC4B|nr:hypothetical protein [Zooshikella ganghwensis]MBU2709030.1 hypothetical protein [Zooshikella ganghwensis]
MNTYKKLALTFLSLGTAYASAAFAENSTNFIEIVIDQTSSMSATRSSTGNSRFADAISSAVKNLQLVNDRAKVKNTTLLVGVSTFDSSQGFKQRVDFVTPEQALDTLQQIALESPRASTPLADALCSAADELYQESVPSGKYSRYIYFYTDLNENQSKGSCSGSDWQSKVIQKFFSGFPHPIMNVTMFTTKDNLTTPNYSLRELNGMLSRRHTTNNNDASIIEAAREFTWSTQLNGDVQNEVLFFTYLANYTNGSAVGYSDESADPIIDSSNTSGSGCDWMYPSCKE